MTPGKGSLRSIGGVLAELRQEFPEVTISKIRFLESQGLVRPERSASGYRKFSERDVERLRYILRQQKEHFLPLKVIKSRLDSAVRAGGDHDTAVGAGEDGDVVAVDGTILRSRKELLARSGLTEPQLRELEGFGLVAGRRSGSSTLYDEDALTTAQLAAQYVRFGLDARHLRSLKTAAEREAELYRQVVAPLRGARSSNGNVDVADTLRQLVQLGSSLRAQLLQRSLDAT